MGRESDMSKKAKKLGLLRDPSAEVVGFDPPIASYVNRPPDPHRGADVRINTPRGPLYDVPALDYLRDRDKAIEQWQMSRRVTSKPQEDPRHLSALNPDEMRARVERAERLLGLLQQLRTK